MEIRNCAADPAALWAMSFFTTLHHVAGGALLLAAWLCNADARAAHLGREVPWVSVSPSYSLSRSSVRIGFDNAGW